MKVIYEKKTLKREIVLSESKTALLLEVFNTKGRLLDEKIIRYTNKNRNVLRENSINGNVLNDKIRDEELHEFSIIHRESFIEELCRWIGECKTPDKQLMLEDLKMLIQLEDEYIFSSNRTNDYIYTGDSRFNETCEELLELNKTIDL